MILPINIKNSIKEANELIRQQQQGLGKPIISFISGEIRTVKVGNQSFQSCDWNTFPDFLIYYLITIVLGKKWFDNELKKIWVEKHIIVQWYEEYYLFQQNPKILSGNIGKSLATGNLYCLLSLAYNFYLLDHNINPSYG